MFSEKRNRISKVYVNFLLDVLAEGVKENVRTLSFMIARIRFPIT